ncbi:RagB/SusD family nutrient uptake outer membrane protein [Chitinophaga oryzae]|uniref:RagB/SusD family nutrient uptake outer membrane protein n=1 Tax=Chitinophaga oryzae TaxID=2725414 RepID=A0AAE7D859_9BACT|nr:RagB/SusD family nutrient uptake outer membrane protein [Chitinophaga oryzae]QJB33511.1 RagB/SusD family nutrient uptake outer membrane protein [Chitinophaga oryzae]QJB40032.1 RagB/SusD family nutrient uptake outer membrane protein [Chitinophaga oryzae]
MNIKWLSIIGVTALMLICSCKSALDLKPKTDLDAGTALTGYENLKAALNGVYSLVNDFKYLPRYMNLVELSTDNTEVMKAGNNATTAGIECYSFKRTASMLDIGAWNAAYKAIYHANMVINAIADDAAPNMLQLKGEALFLRAMLHMQLVQVFGKPYAQNAGAHPGIPYVFSTDAALRPSRNTVKEVYSLAAADYEKAAGMIAETKSNAYAGKAACWAALADLYLNAGDAAKAISYADKVINSNQYTLMTGSNYLTYFSTDHSSAADKETIFTIKNLDSQGKGFYGLGYSYTQTKYAAVSAPLLSLLTETAGDVRLAFYTKLSTPGGDRYFTNKFVQNGNPAVSSPVMYRLTDMYLVRAEANAKTNPQASLDDVNLLRKRAGITGSGLYQLSDLHGRASVLQVVLDEARIECAFENGRRRAALLRNGLPMVRDYAGSTVPGSHVNIAATDNSVIYPLPATEITVNPNLTQNPF